MRITPIDSESASPPGEPDRRVELRKPLTPFRVIFTRLPRAIPSRSGSSWGLAGKQKIEPELQHLVQGHVAALNGCGFCVDIGRAFATYRGFALDKPRRRRRLADEPALRCARARALAYVEEATRSRHVSDETFAALRAHFDDEQIVAITWLNAVENYFNLLNAPLEIESDGPARSPSAARPTGPAAPSRRPGPQPERPETELWRARGSRRRD